MLVDGGVGEPGPTCAGGGERGDSCAGAWGVAAAAAAVGAAGAKMLMTAVADP